MTDPTYRESLLARLELAGPVAVPMLLGQAELDLFVLTAALEAATLLEPTLPEDPRVTAVLTAVPGSVAMEPLAEAILTMPPLEPPPQGQELERHDWLHGVVETAALRPLLPAPAAERLRLLLEDLEGRVLAWPEGYVDLAPASEWLVDELRLPATHAARSVLDELAFTASALAEPLPTAATRAAFAAVDATLRARWRSPFSGWAEWLRELPRVAEWLVPQLDAPVLAAAAGPTAPADPASRLLLWSGPGEAELTLVHLRGEVFLEVYPPQDAAPSLGGRSLVPASTVPDVRAWALPADRPGDAVLRCTVAGAELSIDLASPNAG